MNFNQACESMGKGIPVESLVSKITYEMSKDGLMAEGLLVSFDYLTAEEANGKWREVTIIESVEELEKLSPKDKERILSDAYQHALFNEKRNIIENGRGGE